jgi:hypothetical protein
VADRETRFDSPCDSPLHILAGNLKRLITPFHCGSRTSEFNSLSGVERDVI